MTNALESKILSTIGDVVKKIDPRIGSEVNFMVKNNVALSKINSYLRETLPPEKSAELMERFFDAFGDKLQLYVENKVEAEVNAEKSIYGVVENLFDIPLEFTVEINSKEGENNVIFDEAKKENVKVMEKTLLIDSGKRAKYRFSLLSKKEAEVTIYWIAALTEFPWIRRVDKTIVKFY
jgi:hypothetical protein